MYQWVQLYPYHIVQQAVLPTIEKAPPPLRQCDVRARSPKEKTRLTVESSHCNGGIGISKLWRWN
jgi:hypothetical protein